MRLNAIELACVPEGKWEQSRASASTSGRVSVRECASVVGFVRVSSVER